MACFLINVTGHYFAIWVKYNGLTATSPQMMVNKGNHPLLWHSFRSVNHCIESRDINRIYRGTMDNIPYDIPYTNKVESIGYVIFHMILCSQAQSRRKRPYWTTRILWMFLGRPGRQGRQGDGAWVVQQRVVPHSWFAKLFYKVNNHGNHGS